MAKQIVTLVSDLDGKVNLEAPDGMDSVYTFAMPIIQGIAGQVLSYNGEGCEWIFPAGGDGAWTDDGTNVHLTHESRNVGIGTDTPHAGLEISKSVIFSSISFADFPTGGTIGNSDTVESASTLGIAQTTASQSLTIPDPSLSLQDPGRDLVIDNIGTADFTITNGSVSVTTGHSAHFRWSGTAWSPVGSSSGSSGPVGGDLDGTLPNPDVIAIHATGPGGPLRLAVGDIPNNFFLKRFNNTLIGVAQPTETPFYDDGIEIHEVDTSKNLILGPGLASKAQLHLTRTFLTEPLILPSMAADGPLNGDDPTTSVDISSYIKINQSTKGRQVTSIPNPTDTTATGRTLTVGCGSSGSIILYGKYLVKTGQEMEFRWDGFTWAASSPDLRTEDYLSFSNQVSGGSIGAARDTVDVRHGAVFSQTGTPVTMTLATPTDTAAIKKFTTINNGTVAILVSYPGVTIRLMPKTAVDWFWDGSTWFAGGENHLSTGWIINNAATAITPYSTLLDVGIGVLAPVAGTFTVKKSWIVSSTLLSNFTSSGSFGTAATTVDVSSAFTVPQSTTGISLTLDVPLNTTAGRWCNVFNAGTATFVLNGLSIAPGGYGSFFWNGSAWSVPSVQVQRNTHSITPADSPFAAAANDFILANAQATIDINLPQITTAIVGKEIIIKRAPASLNFQNINVNPFVTNSIDGGGTVVLSSTNAALHLIANSANDWSIV